jgi:hypothetical protein
MVMAKQYEITRSKANKHLQLVYPEGMFETLSFEVRLHAPWIGCEIVDARSLRPQQRVEIESQGYTIIQGAAAAPEATPAAA